MARRRFAGLLAATASLAIICPIAHALDVHFDYTSFDNPNTPGVTPHFGQAQFNVLNYPSINGNYMMTSTSDHRSQMLANNNEFAEFYNWLQQRYDAHTTKDASVSADEIDAYVKKYAPSLAAPKWLVLNEMSTSLWDGNATYRAWLVATVAKLNDTYGYKVVTYTPFANPSTFGSDWRALAAKSYIGVENYLSGEEVMRHGTDYASWEDWAYRQYVWSKTPYGNLGVDSSRLFLGEDFANTASGVPYGRAGLSAADWDMIIQIRQDAIRRANYPGYLAYGWSANSLLSTEAEQIEHEYWYRTRLVMAGQQPQWLSDAAINVNGTIIPLSWSQQLNWLGGVPNAAGAIANFYKTNTAARTVTLDGNKTVGTLSFNSASSYTISPGAGGILTLNNSGSAASVAVPLGTHTIAVPVAVSGSANFNISGTLSLTGGFSSTVAGTITRTGAGTLNIGGPQSHVTGELFTTSGGITNLNSNATNLAVTVGGATVNFNAPQTLGALAINAGGKANSLAAGNMIDATSLAITGGQLDLVDDAMIVRSGTLGSPTSSAYSGLTGLVQSGRNNGAWNGNGIITSMTAAKSPSVRTTVAIAKASDALGFTSGTKVWRGQAVDANAILVMYTYAGDANLSGKIDADDYFQIDSNLNKSPSLASYFHGDFNYDGTINGDDYFVIDSAFAAQGAPFFSAAAPAPLSVVPEPTGIALLALAATFIPPRRRRA